MFNQSFKLCNLIPLYNNFFTSKKVVLAETLTKLYKDIHRIIIYNLDEEIDEKIKMLLMIQLEESIFLGKQTQTFKKKVKENHLIRGE